MDRPTLASILEQSKKLSSSIQDPYASTSSQGQGHAAGGYRGLPSIELGLEQIEQQSRKLAQRSAYASNGAGYGNGAYGSNGGDGDESARAQYLLAQAQVDTTSLNRTLASLQPSNAFAPLQAHSDNDISFLTRQAHQSILVDCVEQGRQETMRDFYVALREDMFRDWEKQKASIFEELGRHHPALLSSSNEMDPGSNSPSRKPRKSAGYSNSTTYLNQAASLGPGSELALHTKMMKYDSVIARLNTCRKEGSSIGILTLLSDAITPSTSFTMGQSDRALPLQDTYTLLKYILGEKDSVGQSGEFVKDEKRQGCYSAAYSTEGQEGKEGIRLRVQVANGSRSFLEDQFMKHVEATLLKNPQQANLGGVPSNSNKLRAYVSITYNTGNGWNPILEVIGGQPIWARLFFLIRAGLKEDALAFATSKEMQSGINASEPNFLSYFKDWSANSKLSKANKDRFQNEYNQKIRYLTPATSASPLSTSSSTSDPFKLALYKIIGRADLNKRNIPGVTDKTEHWLWLQLSLVQEEAETPTSLSVQGSKAGYGLRDLANVLRKFGEGHWDPKKDRPGLYFQVLLMSGQFERAVAFLYSRQAHRTDAVHFAVALAYYGLIRVPDLSKTSEMDYLTAEMDVQGYEICRLNIARYLHRYYWSFVKADPTHALQYIALINLGTPDGASVQSIREEQKAVIADYVKELLVASKAYAPLLGELDTEGKKMPGAIPQNAKLLGVEDSKTWIKSIVASVVTSSDSNVSFNDTILLYNIAENYDSVIGTLNSELGTSLSQPSQPNVQINGGANQDVLATAKSVLEHYEGNGIRLNRQAKETLQKLIRLKDAFGLYEAGRLDDALVTFETCQMIPMQSEGDVVPIIKAADDFKSLDEAIVRNFDSILLMAMNILFSIHQRLKESPYGDVSRQNRMSEMRTKARALMMFAGMLRYKLSAETYHQLSRQEVYLH